MPRLAKSAQSVKLSIDCYWETAHSHPDLIKDAAKVRQWKWLSRQRWHLALRSLPVRRLRGHDSGRIPQAEEEEDGWG